jgi:hypothetical protein
MDIELQARLIGVLVGAQLVYVACLRAWLVLSVD